MQQTMGRYEAVPMPSPSMVNWPSTTKMDGSGLGGHVKAGEHLGGVPTWPLGLVNGDEVARNRFSVPLSVLQSEFCYQTRYCSPVGQLATLMPEPLAEAQEGCDHTLP